MPRKAFLAALVAAVAVLSPRAHADPALPTGWIAGGPTVPMAPARPPASRSRVALQLHGSPPRPALAAVPLSLADVETVDIGPAPTYAQVDASNADPGGEAPTDLFVAPGCGRVSVSGHAVGSITLGLTEPIGPQSAGGVPYAHGQDADGKHLYRRAQWETVDRLPDGTLRFTETVARFHVETCKARVARRYTAIARPILNGRAYVFRTRCPACVPEERDQLHVLTPNGGWGSEPYASHAIPLVAGSSEGFRTHVETARLRRFALATGRTLPDPPENAEAVIGIEAAQTLGEKAPLLIAYTFDAQPREWGF